MDKRAGFSKELMYLDICIYCIYICVFVFVLVCVWTTWRNVPEDITSRSNTKSLCVSP
jgi:hypothetical protein